MPVTYVTDGAWGSGSGVPHTAAEADAIIYDLVQQIAALSASGPVSLTGDINQTGATFTFVLSDASESDPITLPRPVQRPTLTFPVSGTTLTPTGAQSNNYFRCTNSAGCLVTIEDDTDILVDTEWHFRHCAEASTGGGAVTFAADTGVTINQVEGKIFETRGEGAVVVVKKVATGVFDIFGGLADA